MRRHFFRTREVARMLEISESTLRQWERLLPGIPSYRTAGKHRRYSREDIQKLRIFRDLIQAGIRREKAARWIRHWTPGENLHPDATPPSIQKVFLSMLGTLNELDAILEEMERWLHVQNEDPSPS